MKSKCLASDGLSSLPDTADEPADKPKKLATKKIKIQGTAWRFVFFNQMCLKYVVYRKQRRWKDDWFFKLKTFFLSRSSHFK